MKFKHKHMGNGDAAVLYKGHWLPLKGKEEIILDEDCSAGIIQVIEKIKDKRRNKK